MESCVKCKQAASFRLQEWYCARCFCDVIERRIKKSIRAVSPFVRGETLLVVGEVTQHCVQLVVQGLPVTMIQITSEEIQNAIAAHPQARLVLPSTMEHDIGLFLGDFFQGKVCLEDDHRVVKLFHALTLPELRKYADLKGLPIPVICNNPVQDLLDSLEEKYPSSKFSLQKSVIALHEVMRNANVKKITIRDNCDGCSGENNADS